MKSDPKFSLIFVTGIFLLLFSLFWFFHTPNRKFEKLCDELFVTELSKDGLSLHYTLAYPENYGIETSEAKLPVYDHTEKPTDYTALSSAIEELEKIDKNNLSNTNRETYDLLLNYLKEEQKSFTYFYYNEPLSPTSGMQCQLPVLLAEYALRNKKDVEHYLSLLQSIPAYLKGLGDFEKDKAEQGLFMSSTACNDVIRQCNQIITDEALATKEHFLQTTFRERLERLVQDGILTQEEMNTYINANDTILSESVLPAYKTLSHTMTALDGSGSNDQGLCYYPNGKEYYALLVSSQTGSSKSINEILTCIQTAFTADYTEFTNCARSFTANNSSSLFSISEPAKMLLDLEKQIYENFPPYPSLKEEILPSYEIKEVSKSMEDYLSPAFYLTPPIDDISENVIYINNASSGYLFQFFI